MVCHQEIFSFIDGQKLIAGCNLLVRLEENTMGKRSNECGYRNFLVLYMKISKKLIKITSESPILNTNEKIMLYHKNESFYCCMHIKVFNTYLKGFPDVASHYY